MVIDASTQPGNTFGVSDSRIKIIHDGSDNFSQGMTLAHVQDVEIYSLYFSDFFSGLPSTFEIRCAIFIPGYVKNIKIGAPGKGNVFYNNAISIANRYHWGGNSGDHFSDGEIRSNFFGLSADGTTANTFGGAALMIKSFRNLTLGGNTEAEGNRFAGNTEPLMILSCDSINNNGYLKILNNTFGSDYSKTIPIKCGSVTITSAFLSTPAQLPDLAITVSKNTFNNPSYVGANSCNSLLSINEIGGFITITGNKMGNLVGNSSCQTTAIGIWNCENGIIGGPNPDDQNIISKNYSYGISLIDNRNITIQKNSLFCNSTGIRATSIKVAIPEVKIMSENGTNQLSGTATPNCKIELFETIQCNGCSNGEIYMGETISDNNGNWSFTGAYTSAITARATTANRVSGEFSKPAYIANLNIQHTICNQNNGYIKGMQPVSGTKYYWIKNFTDTIFNQLELNNIGAGTYEFVVEQTKYCTVSYRVTINDNSPAINEQGIIVVQPSCGLFNGSIINNISLSGIFNNVFWINENRDTIAYTANLANAGEGKYKLFVWNTTYGCADSTDWFVLINQSGPSLNTNNVQIASATCDNANGSITNVSVANTTGTVFIQWIDTLNNIVGNTLDLINKPAGKYKLKLKDGTTCDTIITQWYIIPAIGKITIDTTGKHILPAGCTVNNGAIENINVTGADTYQWQNITTGSSAGGTKDIYNLSQGSYQLFVSNSLGCNAASPFINIPQSNFLSNGANRVEIQDGMCGENNGMINILSFNNDPSLYTFRWVDSASNQLLGANTAINNLAAGTYFLYATDTNGCENKILTSVVRAYPKPVINESQLNTVPDQCSTKKGAITGVSVTGLINTPAYTWTDQNNNVVATTLHLNNVGEGNYQLTVKDGNACTVISGIFTVTNNNNAGIVPVYEDMVIPRNAPALLKVKNFETGTYVLYSDAAGSQIIEENTTGIFTTPIVNADKYFYVQHIKGNCKSPVTPVKITVVDRSYFAIASAFTPNSDGLNDLLRLTVIGYIDVEYFKIYNRNGEEVFSTNTINNGWDGFIKGVKQQGGVFVWMAKGKDINGNTVTGKGSFVLIR